MTAKNEDRLNAWGPAVFMVVIGTIGNLLFLSYTAGEMKSDMRSEREASAIEIKRLDEKITILCEQIRTLDERQWNARQANATHTKP